MTIQTISREAIRVDETVTSPEHSNRYAGQLDAAVPIPGTRVFIILSLQAGSMSLRRMQIAAFATVESSLALTVLRSGAP